MNDFKNQKYVSIEDAAKSPTAFNVQDVQDLSARLKAIEEKGERLTNLSDKIASKLNDLDVGAKNIQSSVSVTQLIMAGVIVVFFIAFLTFVFDAWNFHRSEYREYRQTLQSTKDKLDTKEKGDTQKQIDEVKRSIQSLNSQIQSIKK